MAEIILDSMSKPSGSGSLAVTGKSLCSRSLTGENISDLESESESESEFLILGPSLPRTPISVPSLEPELSPSLSLSPSSTPESEPVSVPGPSRPSVLQESAPPAPTLVYQRRSKPDLLQKQIQSPEPEVSTENDSSSDDCAISDTCDTNPVDLPIALRKDKRSCPSLYRHPISQYVSTKHLSTQYQSFIAAVDSVKIPSSVEEALQNRNWVQAMDEEMRALEKNVISPEKERTPHKISNPTHKNPAKEMILVSKIPAKEKEVATTVSTEGVNEVPKAEKPKYKEERKKKKDDKVFRKSSRLRA
ncbi:hypothetical protein KIW84_015381 [Lathyrus oleraceus]|uniref:Uncharacterized protein n=1 Tax=Pisum sativum TaxID=3888 RepID=A0A9D5BQG1_PEA|nr:hypothetical protein KIW84_015381 [Pisum sativum]